MAGWRPEDFGTTSRFLCEARGQKRTHTGGSVLGEGRGMGVAAFLSEAGR